jgi:hypothetical protein
MPTATPKGGNSFKDFKNIDMRQYTRLLWAGLTPARDSKTYLPEKNYRA